MNEEQKKSDAFDTFKDDDNDGAAGPARLHPYVIPVAILIAGAMIAGAVAYTNRGARSPAQPAAAAVGQTVTDSKTIAGDAPFLGSPDAPVALVEFADFQCPFCAATEGVDNEVSASLKSRDPSWQAAIPLVIKNYVATGKVKFAYRDFAFLGPESEWASEGAACANEQGKFWQYHDYLYRHQNGENQGAFSKDNLKHFALVLGLDGNKFNACLDSDKFLPAVRKAKSDGSALGVSGTPATFIGGHALIGAVPYDQFSAAIEAELQKLK